jgi:hypothetical protein
MNNFLDMNEWNAEHSSVWQEILSRWGDADYEDLTKRAERQATLEIEWNTKKYARNRKAEYDALNQFEMQYDDKEDGTTTWEDAIAAIKTKYPKP